MTHDKALENSLGGGGLEMPSTYRVTHRSKTGKGEGSEGYFFYFK